MGLTRAHEYNCCNIAISQVSIGAAWFTITPVERRKGSNVRWFFPILFTAVVIWDVGASLLFFAFDKQGKELSQRPELQATCDQGYRRVNMLLKQTIFAILGTLLAIPVGLWVGLLSSNAAMVFGGTDVGLLAVVLLYHFRPWSWKYYSAPAKRILPSDF